MIVENHDSGDHAGSNHEHDAVEIGPEIYIDYDWSTNQKCVTQSEECCW